MMNCIKKITHAFLLMYAFVVLIALSIPPAMARDERTPEQQIAALTAEVRMLKSTIKHLRVENNELREQLTRHEAKPSEVSEEEAMPTNEQANTPKPQQLTYRGQPISQLKLNTLWRRFGKQYIVHDDVVFDIGSALVSNDIGRSLVVKESSYAIYSIDDSIELTLAMPYRVTVKRLVKGGALCLLREVKRDIDREVIVLGEFSRGQKIKTPLLPVWGSKIPNNTQSGKTFELIKPITQEQFIKVLNDGMAIRRYSAKIERTRKAIGMSRQGPVYHREIKIVVDSEEIE